MLETAKPASSTNSRCLRLTDRVALTSGMVHSAEANAYTPTSMPMRDSDTPRFSDIWGRIPEGISSDSSPTKVTLAIRPKTNHSGARSRGVAGDSVMDASREPARQGRMQRRSSGPSAPDSSRQGADILYRNPARRDRESRPADTVRKQQVALPTAAGQVRRRAPVVDEGPDQPLDSLCFEVVEGHVRLRDSSGAKKLRCKFQSALYPLLGEPHRLLLAHGIEEVASVMQPTHDIEVITFPGAVRVEEVGGKKR